MKGKIVLVLIIISSVLALQLTLFAAPDTKEFTFEGECRELFYSSKVIPIPELEGVKGIWMLTADPKENKAKFIAEIEIEKRTLQIHLIRTDAVKKDFSTLKIIGDIKIKYKEYQETLTDTKIQYEISTSNLHVSNRIWLDLWGSDI